jgi:transcriptional regulator with XRE-family HTH domain
MEVFHDDKGAPMASKRVGSSSKGAGSIGERLAQMRKDAGLTQGELAEKLGATQSLVSKYERGELLLHGELIRTLAETFGVSADEILGIAKKKAEPEPIVRDRRLLRRLQRLEQLSKRDKEAVLRTLDAFLVKTTAA